MELVRTLNHPLVDCHLSILRDKNTTCNEFRSSMHRLSTLLAFAATEDLPTKSKTIETPICETEGTLLENRIGLVPILRAGIAMVDAMLNLIPTSEVWHLGLYRDEATAQPVGYYNKLPDRPTVDLAFVLDPMLATGGSASMACETLSQWGVQKIKMLSIIAAPEGIEKLTKDFPEIEIVTCSIDEQLNDKKYIVPGLGDAGDRIFNTLV
ncbi:MAG: uracil phosphoribosyltransferase [Planctomycetota bacterium]